MENETIAPNDIITSLKQFGHNRTEHSTIKTLLKNFLYSDMAIKDNACVEKDYACVVPMKPAISISDRMKAINDAKQAFLYSTVNSTATFMNADSRKEQPTTLYYAQLAIASESGDARSTGGGRNENIRKTLTNHNYVTPLAIAPIIKKKIETQHRKVSFKIKNTANRRPPVATTKTISITTNKVSELTKKFNDLVNESHGLSATLTKSKIVKTIEDIQKSSPIKNSTPTSTLSSSPNIKIVVRQRRTSKKRSSNSKRCSSADSIEKFGSPDNESEKSKVIRSKSDGTRAPKASKKKLKFPVSHSKSLDKVDGNIAESEESKSPKTSDTPLVVKNVVKKFECEIIAKSNTDTLRKSSLTSSSIISKEKPKVPEKKTSIVLTKNVVVKDGTLKFISKIKQQPEVIKTNFEIEEPKQEAVNIPQRRESFYEKNKFKTNYIFSDKKPMQIVDIIPEDLSDSNNEMSSKPTSTVTQFSNNPIRPTTLKIAKDNQVYEDVENDMVPNESFLWRRKSTSIASPDSEKSILDGSYSILSLTPSIKSSLNVADTVTNEFKNDDSISLTNEQNISSNVSDLDFESNLVEAYNKEVIIGYTTKVVSQQCKEENDYESFEPIDIPDEVRVSVRSVDRASKINCPLPEIPKINLDEKRPENVYQSLIEMRSHPEGDENNLHNYETCNIRPTERTRGDGDSDDGYEYCKSPIKPYCVSTNVSIRITDNDQHTKTNYEIEKSVSTASTASYEKIGSDRIYEKVVLRPKQKDGTLNSQCSRNSYLSDYSNYNDGENIYDSIKHGDEISLSHCYESIPNSPSLVKQGLDLRNKLSARIQKRLSFDTMSNISQSTISSEQKTNSIYGQRSIMSYNGQEIAFQVPSSETSVSDRSDDWVDVSDEEKTEEQNIVIVHERNRGRKSPISWSQKVRHQWLKAPKTKGENLLITSESMVYIDTNSKSQYYCKNDDALEKTVTVTAKTGDGERMKTAEDLEQNCLHSIRTVLRNGALETQDLIAFIEGDSSDSGHVYESLEPATVAPPVVASPAPEPIEEDFDSFDSDSDIETNYENKHYVKSTDPITPVTNLERLPEPPSGGGGNYTLTKIASAAQKKMRQLKRNLTKKYSEAIDGKTFQKFTSQNNWNDSKSKTNSPIYENCEKPIIQHQHIYSNFNFEQNPENGLAKPNGNTNNFNDEIKNVLGDKKIYGELPPPLPEKPPPEKPSLEKPTTPTSDTKKDIGSLSRKTYLSFKSRFRRASSMAVDINEVPSALKITNSTFYLTDSMDGDSGFSNCSDTAQPTTAGGSNEAIATSPAGLSRRRDGNRRIISESTPCLAPVDRSPLAPPDRSFLAPSDRSFLAPPDRMIAPLERPSLPPPPPPPLGADLAAVNEELKRLLPTLSRKDKGIRTRTSWYAECGALEEISTPASSRPSSTSWYAEAGLLQAGNISSSSGASSGSHPASPLPHSLFTHEPLYQFYNAAKLESVCRETTDSDSDAYESTPFTKRPSLPVDSEGADSGGSGSSGGSVSAGSRPSAMALVAPRGPARTLWCEVPEVVNSAVLSSLVPAQKRLQEAKFELLTSEASYLNSLNVLEAHFIAHPAFREPTILSRADREALFSSILPVRKSAQILMVELEKCWQENILLQGICDIVRRHAEKHFHVYVKYCEHQGLMVKALQRLRERPTFAMALKRLESHPACQSLSLHSFLMLPMQRITRLPLLMDAVLKNLGEGDVEHQSCMDALATLNSFVSQCNEGARNTERIEEMYRLSQVIEFPATMNNPPSLAPACGRRDRRPIRWLVRSGEMTQLLWKTDEIKLTFGKKYHKVPLHLFLFNDLLVITKKKSEHLYMAVDYCARSLLEVCSADSTAHAKHTLLLTLLENHLGKTVEMLMSCESETDVSRWSEALCPPTAADGETVYGGWDCPQVAALYAYAAAQPDELTLTEGDIVNVTRKTSEGWYYGERIRDGETGWFPGAYTVEIASPHVRARNLRQRYRLLALSGTYLGQKKKT